MTDQLRIDFNAVLQKMKEAGVSGLSHTEEEVLRHLLKGRDNAIAMPALAEAVGISTRDLQSVIQHLINDHGIMIASATGRNHGYYFPESEEEYRAAVDQLKHRIISLARRIRAIDRQAFEEIFGQGNIEEAVKGEG